jgi:hypothetical protein
MTQFENKAIKMSLRTQRHRSGVLQGTAYFKKEDTSTQLDDKPTVFILNTLKRLPNEILPLLGGVFHGSRFQIYITVPPATFNSFRSNKQPN